jgi:hypothetical protein
MARLTLVANSGLCPDVKKALIEMYLEFVPQFAKKYGTDATRITIPSDAAKWEGHVAKGNYRLDLQGTANGFGNLQAQFGTGHENCSKGGSYGGVLMLCNTPFTVEEVQEALGMSLATKGKSLVQMALDTEPAAAAAAVDNRRKTKPGKKEWTPDTQY